MSSQNANGKLDMANLIVSTWSKRFYENLKNDLVLADIFARDYEGEIQAVGDTVKVNQLNLAAAQTLTDDKQKFDFSQVSVSQFSLQVNRNTVHAVEITNLANLQSQEYMESLMKEVNYQLALKMEQEILAYYISKFTTTKTIATSSDMAAVDLTNLRAAAGRAKWGANDRFAVLSPEYHSDLLNKNQIISADFVPGQPLLSQKIPKVAGWNVLESNLLAVDKGLVFHKSALQLAMQRGVNQEVVSMKSAGKLSFALVSDFVWDMKEFDTTRGWYLGN